MPTKKTETEEDNSDGLTPRTDAGLNTCQRNYVLIFQAMADSLAYNTTHVQQRQQGPSTRLHYDRRRRYRPPQSELLTT